MTAALYDCIKKELHSYTTLKEIARVSVPDEAKLWKERAELARYMLKGITLEKDACVAENIRLSKLLDDNGIKY